MLCIFILYISILTHAPPSPPFLTFGARHSHGCGRLYACSPPGGTQCPPFAVLVLVINTHYYFMASVAHLQAPVPAQVSRVKSEAHRYLELPAAPMNTDPLEWWAANEINFPALSVMARQYLGVPATSASAERLFSLAGRAFDDLRQRMKEEMLEILMWARINKEKRQRD
jgi:hypothetical protein